jgi:hypothetical protein
MTRVHALLVTALVSLSALAGCNRSPDDDRFAEKAVKEAAESQPSVQAGADDEPRGAVSFTKACDDLRASSQLELDAVAKRLDELEARASTLSARHRDDVIEALRNLDEMRSSVQESVSRIDALATEEFDAFKATLTEQIEELQRSANEIGSRM